MIWNEPPKLHPKLVQLNEKLREALKSKRLWGKVSFEVLIELAEAYGTLESRINGLGRRLDAIEKDAREQIRQDRLVDPKVIDAILRRLTSVETAIKRRL